MASPFELLEHWQITARELAELVAANPSLRGMLHGYVAELKLRQTWFADERLVYRGKHDDHDRGNKGDSIIEYKGGVFNVECKSLQTKTVRRAGEKWTGKAQVDGSDRRTINFADGSELTTTLLVKGEFDLLAVNVFEFGKQWRFVFAKNSDLPTSTYRKYTPEQQSRLIKSLVPVTWPPEPPFFEEPFRLLDEIAAEKAEQERLRRGVEVDDRPLKATDEDAVGVASEFEMNDD